MACTPAGLYVRRNVIEDVLDGQDLLLPVRRLSDHGRKAWQEAVERGVAKDPASLDVGGRTLQWLKVKQPERGREPNRKS